MVSESRSVVQDSECWRGGADSNLSPHPHDAN